MSAFVVPIDPKAPSSLVPNIDAKALWSSLPTEEKPAKAGTTRLFFGATGQTGVVAALSSLGDKFDDKKGNERREIVRTAVGSAVKQARDLGDGVKHITVDAPIDPHAAAVAAELALYKFTLKTKPPSPFDPNNKEPLPKKEIKPLKASKEWETGIVVAKAQNLARTLMELPANMITPTTFCERVKTEFKGIDNVEIFVRDEAWAEQKGMRTFLSVTRGTNEPAKFLEIHYKGAANKAEKPLAFVGKGITFDSGGISLKPAEGMKAMRADMGGAATIVASTLAIAQLKVPINVITIAPLTENMPGPSATKPGDIIYAMNGKSVEVDNTDAEGRLILSDAMYYTSTVYKPHTLIDVATLTGAVVVALGEVFSGVYSTTDRLWEKLYTAGEIEFDRFWRLPLDEEYGPQIYSSNADLCNIGGKPAGSCTAALFLKAFVEGIEAEDGKEAPLQWAHIDMAGTMEATRPGAYQEKGMTGRPTRALVEFAKSLVSEK